MPEMPIAPVVAPTNGAHPTTPQKPAATKPLDAKPPEPVKSEPVDDSEEYEHVVDGKPVKVRLTKAQRQIEFQKSRASSERFKQAADMKARADELLRGIDDDFDTAMRKAGKDPDKLIAAHLERRAKLELMTPEQREAAALKQRAEKSESELKAMQEERRAERQKQIDAATFKQYEEGLISAADKAGLPSDAAVLWDLADIGMEHLEKYDIALTAQQIVDIYQERYAQHLEAKDKKLHSVLKGKKLLDYLGESTLAEVKAALAQMDAESLKEPPKPRNKVPVKAHERTIKGGHISENDFDKKFKL